MASGAVANQINNPVAFGLSYWALYMLNRLLNLPVTAGFVSFVSTSSIVLLVAGLVLVYWKTSKIAFKKPAYDLALVMLLPVAALFLSYRIICEQFFIWAIPFLIILCIAGRVKITYYWGISIVALLYAVLNCPLPFFFLPLAPRYTGVLIGMIHAVWSVEPLRIVSLAILGFVFSILLIAVLFQLAKARNLKEIGSENIIAQSSQ